MYFLLLLLSALLILSLLATNWPVKLYHHAVLKKVGAVLGAAPVHGSLLLAGVYSEIQAPVLGREVRIRFVEGSMDALHADSGLEMRLPFNQEAIVEFYRARLKKREWGDFKRFLTGDAVLDTDWFILSNDPEQAGVFYRSYPFPLLLKNRSIEQLLFHPREMVIRFQKGDPVRAVTEIVRILPEFFRGPA